MKTVDITTDKCTYTGILVNEEKLSSFDNDYYCGEDWFDETYLLLTSNGLIRINHHMNGVEPALCDCDECRSLGECEPDCNPNTCTKCNGSVDLNIWCVDMVISKEEIIEYLKK